MGRNPPRSHGAGPTKATLSTDGSQLVVKRGYREGPLIAHLADNTLMIGTIKPIVHGSQDYVRIRVTVFSIVSGAW